MQRRDFMKAMGAGMAALAAGDSARAQGTKRPNILLYVTDDQGRNDAGCYGHPVVKTPGMDALAAEGTRFTHGFACCASCSPSRSVILTGMYTHSNGQYGLAHAAHHFASFDNIQTLPVLLGEAGYRTLCAGKFHVNPETTYHFGEYLNAPSPVRLADRCKDFLTRDAAEPFFLYFCTTEPHRNFARDGSSPVAPDAMPVPPFLPDTPECREELAEYAMSLERADSGLVRLMALLKETGQWDNTVVMFVSDNGIPFPGAKTTVYDPGLNLPCIMRVPGQKPGVVSDAMVSWLDITPTLLDFAAAVPEKPMYQGRSLRSIEGGEHAEGWDEVYASHTFHEVTMYYPMRMVRTRTHKLIWNIAYPLEFPFASDLYESKTWQAVLERGDTQYGPRTVDALLHRPQFELYDLVNDPNETVNLAGDPAQAELLAALKEKLRAFQKQTKDQWILKWDRE